jgi:MazG family protein
MKKSSVEQLMQTIEALRHPETGCPWDLKQTHQTLSKYAIEEGYELAEALQQGDDKMMIDELADVLLQVLLNARLAEERKAFDFYQIAQYLNDKLIRRHPHVFGDNKAKTDEEIKNMWNQIKAQEKEGQIKESLLDGIKTAQHPLNRLEKTLQTVREAGYGFDDFKKYFEKYHEEIDELYEAYTEKHPQKHLEEELGDMLLNIMHIAVGLNLSLENSLKAAYEKFERRFRYSEKKLGFPKDFKNFKESQLEDLWVEAKDYERESFKAS